MLSFLSRQRRNAFGCFGLALSLVTFLTPAARAQPLADRVPADAMIYIGWTGFQDQTPGFKGSHLEAVLQEGNFQQLVDETFPKLLQKISDKDRQAAEIINIAKPIVVPMLKHQTAIFVGPPAFAGRNQPPSGKGGLICNAGADADAMHTQIQNLLGAAPQQVQQMVKVTKDGNTVSVLVGYDAPPAGGIGASPAFKSMTPHMVPNASAILYVDMEQVTSALNTAITTYGPQEAQNYWPKVRDAIGLAGVKHLVWTSGFDGKEWGDHIFLHVPDPRQGLFALADPSPLSPAAMKIIPATATMAGATRIDVSKLITGLRNAVTQVEPRAGEKVDQLFQQASKSIGMDVQKDVLDNLGEEWVYYVDPFTGGRSVFGGVYINHLRNPQKAEAAFTKLETLLNQELAKNIHEKDISVKFLTTKSGDTTIHYLGTPLISPSWAVKGDYLIIAAFPQMVAGAADQVGGNAPSILDNPKFKAVRDRLGVPNANGFSFIDLQQTAPDGYALWTAISRLTGFSDMFGVPAPAMILPPLRRLLPHLTPAGAVTWTDKDGLHMKAISPFPGATIIGTDPLGGLVGMLPALAMPAYAGMRKAGAPADFGHAEGHDVVPATRPYQPQSERRGVTLPPAEPEPRPLPRP